MTFAMTAALVATVLLVSACGSSDGHPQGNIEIWGELAASPRALTLARCALSLP